VILRLPSLHGELNMDAERVFVWEIRPLTLFYRIVRSLHAIAVGEEPAEDVFITDGSKRLDAKRHFFVLSDPWADPFLDKKAAVKLYNVIANALNAEYEKKIQLFDYYQKAANIVSDILDELSFETSYNETPILNDILKTLNVAMATNCAHDAKSSLISLIEINASLNIADVLVLVNQRMLLSPKDEEEVFKHAMYTKAKLLFVEAVPREDMSPYEIKWVVENDYDDYVLKG